MKWSKTLTNECPSCYDVLDLKPSGLWECRHCNFKTTPEQLESWQEQVRDGTLKDGKYVPPAV